jgi:ketosteroid isomerase-like protein
MAGNPNLEKAKAGYEAFAEGDMAALNELMADDIVWHFPGDNPLSGDYKGKEEVFGMFAQLAQETGGTFRNEIHDLLANDDHAVALVNMYAERGGRTLEANSVHVSHWKDGKLAEFWSMQEDQGAVDAFYS